MNDNWSCSFKNNCIYICVWQWTYKLYKLSIDSYKNLVMLFFQQLLDLWPDYTAGLFQCCSHVQNSSYMDSMNWLVLARGRTVRWPWIFSKRPLILLRNSLFFWYTTLVFKCFFLQVIHISYLVLILIFSHRQWVHFVFCIKIMFQRTNICFVGSLPICEC